VGGLRGNPTEGLRDGFDDALDVLVDLGNPEPEHAKADLTKPAISPRVVSQLLAVVLAIDFHHQLGFQAREVGKVGAERDLPAKLESAELAPTQAVPQPPLGPGHFSPRRLGPVISGSPLQAALAIHEGRLATNPGGGNPAR